MEEAELGEAIFEWARAGQGERAISKVWPVAPGDGSARVDGALEFFLAVMGGDVIAN
jgi:hypothetical protein